MTTNGETGRVKLPANWGVARAMRGPSGFTLMELMVVVSIIGILASLSMVTWRNAGYKARKSERDVTIGVLVTAIQLSVAADGGFRSKAPAGKSGKSPVNTKLRAVANPPLPMGTQAKAYVPAASGWDAVDVSLSGSSWHSYAITGTANPAGTSFTITAIGDVDGDKVLNTRAVTWKQAGGNWTITSDRETGGVY